MLKKILSIVVLFVAVTAVLVPASDSVLTAIEVAISINIGIAITRLYGKEILVAENTDTRIKTALSAVTSMTALLTLTAVCVVKIEELNWTYIELDDAIMGMMIFGIIGVGLELAGKAVLKLIHRFVAIKSK